MLSPDQAGLSCGRTDRLTSLVDEFGFVVIRGPSLTWEECEFLCHRLGAAVIYEDKSVGYGYDVLVDLDANPDPAKVITGCGPLPVHTDGVLFNNRVDIVVLYCAAAEGLALNTSRTIVCDQYAALQRAPAALLHPIEQNGLEYRIAEEGYFTTQPKQWYPVPARGQVEGVEVLRIAFPFRQGSIPAWETRIPNLNDEDSIAALRQLEDFFLSSEFTYRHEWREGDLLLLDNRRLLHGRERISGTRRLLNGQVVVKTWPPVKTRPPLYRPPGAYSVVGR